MKVFALFLTLTALAQTPGVITVNTNVTATGGVASCAFNTTATPGAIVVRCPPAPSPAIVDTTFLLGVDDKITLQVNRGTGTDAVTLMFHRTATGISWQAGANGTSRSGTL